MSDIRPRLEKILDLYGQLLREAVCQREPKSTEAHFSTHDLVRRFSDYDPTPGKSRTQWLVKTYIKDKHFKLEDLGRAYEALVAFERFKPKLPREQRELSRLTGLRDLEILVDPFVKAKTKARLERDLSSATGRELRRLEEWKARDESIIIQEAEGLATIAVPMTPFAAQWWGRGTRWCTAAEKDNRFISYYIDAPLIVVVCPDGAKFQMHVTKDDTQFMDNTDEKVTQDIIGERWDELKPIIYWMLEQNGWALQYVPTEYQTPRLCCMAIQQNGMALEYVPEDRRTPELCRLAVEQNGRTLYYVPKNKQTSALCHTAVQQNGRALRYVPAHRRTPTLYRSAVEQNGLTITDIPEKYQTTELCRIAVQQNGYALEYIPQEKTTTALRRLAVEQNGMALKYVPENKRTLNLYRIAIQQNGWSLEYISANNRFPELCRLAVEQNGQSLQHVPKKQKTSELCKLAIQQNGDNLRHVPEEDRTPELCCLAVEQNGLALQHVPKKQKTSELCRIAVERNGNALGCVPQEKRTPYLCRLAIEEDGRALRHIPEDQKTLEICLLAIQENGYALKDVPKEYRTAELLALIPPVQQGWHSDILHGLGNSSVTFSSPSATCLQVAEGDASLQQP
jgi:Domain of unknown function (DUF4116)